MTEAERHLQARNSLRAFCPTGYLCSSHFWNAKRPSGAPSASTLIRMSGRRSWIDVGPWADLDISHLRNRSGRPSPEPEPEGQLDPVTPSRDALPQPGLALIEQYIRHPERTGWKAARVTIRQGREYAEVR